MKAPVSPRFERAMPTDDRSLWRYLNQPGMWKGRWNSIAFPVVVLIGAIANGNGGLVAFALLTALWPICSYTRWRARESVADDEGPPQVF